MMPVPVFPSCLPCSNGSLLLDQAESFKICSSQVYMSALTPVGRRKIHLSCPRGDRCDVCLHDRRAFYLAKLSGVFDFDNASAVKLLTITLDSAADLSSESLAARAERLMVAWRKFRNVHLSRTHVSYCGVLELGGKNMRPHLHFILHDPESIMPHALPASSFPTLDHWIASLSARASRIYDFMLKHGLGHYHCEPARSPGGSRNYMSDYLSKAIKTEKHLPGRRLIFQSDNWPRHHRSPKLHALKGAIYHKGCPQDANGSPMPTYQPQSEPSGHLFPGTVLESNLAWQFRGCTVDSVFRDIVHTLRDLDKCIRRLRESVPKPDRDRLRSLRTTNMLHVDGVTVPWHEYPSPPDGDVRSYGHLYAAFHHARSRLIWLLRLKYRYTGTLSALEVIP